MKKTIALFLIAILCFSFVACGSDTPTDNTANAEKTPDTENITYTETADVFENVGSNISCVVRISINPQIELYLDEIGFITDYVYLNEDAEKAFSGTNVLLLYCDDGIVQLLQAAQDSGYLTETSTVEVTSYINEKCEDADKMRHTIDDIFIFYKESVGFGYTYNDIRVGNSGNDSEDNDEKITELAGGIREVVSVDSNGTKTTQHINRDDIVIYQLVEETDKTIEIIFNDEGIPLEHKEYHSDGGEIVILFYPDGTRKSSDYNRPDGFFSMERYAADETVVYRFIFDPEMYDSAQFDANGLVVSTIHFDDFTGGKITTRYTALGERASSLMELPDGSTVESTYKNGQRYIEDKYDASNGYHQVDTFENDVRISSITDGPDGFYSYIYFDSNGNMAEIYTLDNFDRPVHTVYHADGSTVSTFTLEDGTKQKYHYDASGNLTGIE